MCCTILLLHSDVTCPLSDIPNKPATQTASIGPTEHQLSPVSIVKLITHSSSTHSRRVQIMSTVHKISPLVLKIRDRVDKLAPAAHFPLWEWGGDSKRGTFRAGDETFSLRERAAELIYCRQSLSELPSSPASLQPAG
jgi:hypothetical protein